MERKIPSLPQKETHPLAAIHASQQSSTQESHHRWPARTGPPRPIVLPMHRVPRPYPPHPKRNPRLITTQSLVAIQCTGAPSAHIPSQVQDHPTISFFPFYAPAPPRSCDARVFPILRASPAQILRCSSIRWKTPLWALKYEHHTSLNHKQTWFTK
jgi:hypothetical protein